VAARSKAARLLRLWVRIPPGRGGDGCSSVLSAMCYQVEVSCDVLITCPEEYYGFCCVVVCDQETSWMRRPWPTGGCWVKRNSIAYRAFSCNRINA